MSLRLSIVSIPVSLFFDHYNIRPTFQVSPGFLSSLPLSIPPSLPILPFLMPLSLFYPFLAESTPSIFLLLPRAYNQPYPSYLSSSPVEGFFPLSSRSPSPLVFLGGIKLYVNTKQKAQTRENVGDFFVSFWGGKGSNWLQIWPKAWFLSSVLFFSSCYTFVL